MDLSAARRGSKLRAAAAGRGHAHAATAAVSAATAVVTTTATATNMAAAPATSAVTAASAVLGESVRGITGCEHKTTGGQRVCQPAGRFPRPEFQGRFHGMCLTSVKSADPPRRPPMAKPLCFLREAAPTAPRIMLLKHGN
jgi:hypothetical protein